MLWLDNIFIYVFVSQNLKKNSSFTLHFLSEYIQYTLGVVVYEIFQKIYWTKDFIFFFYFKLYPLD